nr:integrase family protein [Sphingomonas sp. Y57]
MRRHDFTPAALDAMTSGRRPDPAVAGLTFVNAPSGRKSWSFRRRLPGSKKILSLTRDYPAVSIADAREWATALNEKIERGIDPREEARAQQAHLAMTIEAAHRLYMEVLRRGDRKKLKPRTISDKQVIFDRDIKPRLGDRLLYDLTDDQCWEAVYDKAEASKDRANKMASELNCFLRWCSGREGRMAGIEPLTHPAPTLTSTWFSTGPKANTRFLSDQEIKWLLQALVAENATYRRGFLLLLLTAARRNELHGAPSSEFADSIWTLPSDRSKNGDINVIALAPWGWSLAQTNHQWLFPSPRLDGPQLSGWFKARDRIHAAMEKIAGAKITSWHFHDLRRTFRSNARRVGIDRDIAELMLNHRRSGIEGIYDKNQQLELRAAGFAAWERYIVKLAVELELVEELNIPSGAVAT